LKRLTAGSRARQYEPAHTSWVSFEGTTTHTAQVGAAMLYPAMPGAVVTGGCRESGARIRCCARTRSFELTISRRHLAIGLLTTATLLAAAILTFTVAHLIIDWGKESREANGLATAESYMASCCTICAHSLSREIFGFLGTTSHLALQRKQEGPVPRESQQSGQIRSFLIPLVRLARGDSQKLRSKWPETQSNEAVVSCQGQGVPIARRKHRCVRFVSDSH
jgi:hypothetical protein